MVVKFSKDQSINLRSRYHWFVELVHEMVDNMVLYQALIETERIAHSSFSETITSLSG